ncbi:dTDP-4-dehydrorhamnose reductase [Bacteroidales bacterium]|nr:dTDP-4-dehydrorhamnose reductase [Bacteroidales bacterium]
MKILVTGSKGQLGSELAVLASENAPYDFLFHDVETLDLTNEPEVISFIVAEKPDMIVNCAAYTAVDKAEEDIDNAKKINHDVPVFLAKQCAEHGIGFIHVSTDYVFNGQTYIPYKESDPVSPASVYGQTKLDGENGILANNTAVIIRTSWLYSSFGNNFVKTMLRLGESKDELGVIFDQVGTPTYARDLARAIVEILKHVEKHKISDVAGVYHFSNEGVCSWYDFAKSIFELSKVECRVNPIETVQYPTPAKRPHYSVLNKAKIKETFGIEIPYWKDSLRNCLETILS